MFSAEFGTASRVQSLRWLPGGICVCFYQNDWHGCCYCCSQTRLSSFETGSGPQLTANAMQLYFCHVAYLMDELTPEQFLPQQAAGTCCGWVLRQLIILLLNASLTTVPAEVMLRPN